MASLSEIQAILEEIRAELPGLIQRSQIAATQIIVGEGLSSISRRLGLVQAGEFRSGNGIEPGLGFSGVRIGYPPFTYDNEEWHIVGINNDTLQVGIRASDGKLLAGANAVVLDSDGVSLYEDAVSSRSAIKWYNTSDVEAMRFTFGTGTFQFQSLLDGGEFLTHLTFSDATTPYYTFVEDAEQALRTLFEIQGGASGARFLMVADGVNRIDMRAGDDTDDPTFIRLYDSVVTPPAPTEFWEVNFYLRNNKFVIQYDDLGTVRYKYLDLSGTGVTWTHSTTAP